ncbi:MAG: DUF2130 domain-containing protein, partial [candidate division Zixibacteria bacterium]|nr:DUF2130 domain-containing protein [candidate division Zixibacteria bacterium]
MSQESIKCPKCGELIKVTEVITRDIEKSLKEKYEKELSEWKDNEKISIEKEVTERLSESQKVEISDLREQLEDKDSKLEDYLQKELELRKKNRVLDERGKNLELEVARKIDAQHKQIEEGVARRKDEEYRLKNLENEKKLTDLTTQIIDLKRKAEQSSQQMQGEVLEIDLEQILREEFPFDSIDPVGKGVKGADVLQTVKTQSGRICGKILWETKRTKTWSDSWIKKLKDDQRDAKADLAVIVSEALPKGFHHFRQIKSVWVAEIPSAVSLAFALRTILIQVEKTREIQTGKEEKM